jgi:hypothetical protein
MSQLIVTLAISKAACRRYGLSFLKSSVPHVKVYGCSWLTRKVGKKRRPLYYLQQVGAYNRK